MIQEYIEILSYEKNLDLILCYEYIIHVWEEFDSLKSMKRSIYPNYCGLGKGPFYKTWMIYKMHDKFMLARFSFASHNAINLMSFFH